ncbi:MAG: hypothetical protein AAFZ15_08675 [Bacteroidota bacterium]
MKYFSLLFCLFVCSATAIAQFQPTQEGLIIRVSDGTERGRNSELSTKGDIPTSYDVIDGKKGAAANQSAFTDPIYEFGMSNCIQAAAFLERPVFGKAGFMLIFSLNDSIGGNQGTYTAGGQTYKGVYRLIRQKTSPSEVVPPNMTSYRIEGTFFLIGSS